MMKTRQTHYMVVVMTNRDQTPILRIPCKSLTDADERSREARAKWSPDYTVKMLIIH